MFQRIAIALLLLGCLSFIPYTSVAQDAGEDADSQATSEIAAEVPSIEEEESQFDVELSGLKTWTVRTGFGSPLALATSGLSPGSVTLDQSLSVEITGEAFSIFRIEAAYNDQLPDVMQSLAVYLDTEHLDGVLGDFTFDAVPDFTSYMKSMNGLWLEYRLGDAVLTAMASRTEGIPETAVFIGQTAHADVEFTRWLDESMESPTSYRRNLDGLYAYTLEEIYSEDFSSVSFEFAASAGLRSTFNAYEVGYLYDAVTADPELEMAAQDFLVLDADEQVLLLRRNPAYIVRDQLDELVDAYNEQEGLSGSDAKEYPFIEGTDYESAFLNAVLPYAQLVVDDVVYAMSSGERRRFYALGYSDIQADSSTVEVSTNGTSFDAVTDFSMSDYDATFYEEAGILECDFPAAFFTDTSVIRVSLDYKAAEGAFMLGLSLIPGSERVLLNSQVLEPDVDYVMDYEYGMLLLQREIEDTDVLQVDYERYAGGLGLTSAYASNFYGLTLDWPLSDGLSLRANVLQLSDVETSVSNPDAVSTMANRHTIAGIEADITIDDLRADVLIGYNIDVFPFDDNARDATPNEITAIEAGNGVVLFGHRSGFTVYDDGVWETYGVSSGLASYRVQAIEMHEDVVYVGTDQGLTAIELEGSSPFDRAANWSQLIRADELPSASITALVAGDDGIWVGTSAGLAWLPTDNDADTEGAIAVTGNDGEALPAVTDLVMDDETLYVGTEAGVYRLDIDSGDMTLVAGTDVSVVNDLLLVEDTLYVASNRGLRGFREGRSMGWILLGEPVLSLGAFGEEIYYGTADGLTSLDGRQTIVSDVTVIALAPGSGGLWAGGRSATAAAVWRVADKVTTLSEAVTGIPGEDPYVFVDSPASEHTTTGWMSRASFWQSTDTYSISGTVDWQPAGFRAIGTSSRSDRTGWTVTGDVPLTKAADLRLSHEVRLTDVEGDEAQYWMTNDANLSWAIEDGPVWTASVAYGEESADDAAASSDRELSTAFSVRESFFRDALSLNMAWSRYVALSDDPLDEWERESLSLSFDWDVVATLRTSGSWSRPVRRSETEQVGSERLQWDVVWEPSITLGDVRFASVDVEYAAGASRTLSASEFGWTHEGEVRFDITAFDLLQWNVSPDVKLWGDRSDAGTDLHGEVVSRWKRSDWTVRTTVRGHLTELGRPVFYQEGEWTVNVRFAGLDAMDPSVTYSGSHRTAFKGGETALTTSHTLTARVLYAPDDGPRDDASLTVMVKTNAGVPQLTALLDNQFTMNLSPLLLKWIEWDDEDASGTTSYADLRVNTTGDASWTEEAPEFSVSTAARLSVSLPPNWTVAFGATYTLGLNGTIGLYHGVLLEVTFGIDF